MCKSNKGIPINLFQILLNYSLCDDIIEPKMKWNVPNNKTIAIM